MGNPVWRKRFFVFLYGILKQSNSALEAFKNLGLFGRRTVNKTCLLNHFDSQFPCKILTSLIINCCLGSNSINNFFPRCRGKSVSSHVFREISYKLTNESEHCKINKGFYEELPPGFNVHVGVSSGK